MVSPDIAYSVPVEENVRASMPGATRVPILIAWPVFKFTEYRDEAARLMAYAASFNGIDRQVIQVITPLEPMSTALGDEA